MKKNELYDNACDKLASDVIDWARNQQKLLDVAQELARRCAELGYERTGHFVESETVRFLYATTLVLDVLQLDDRQRRNETVG